MNKLKLIALAVLISAAGATTSSAQTTWWRIVNGPGAGVLLKGNGIFINDPEVGATNGDNFIAPGHFTDCECTAHDGHYHGVLFGKSDPNPNTCGWGCVDQVPCTLAEAISGNGGTIPGLDNVINNSTGTNVALRNKLFGILDMADFAIGSDCNSLFRGAMDAFGEELLGAFLNGQLTPDQVDAIVKAVIEYVDLGFEEMDLSFPPTPPPPKPCKVSFMLRRGSAGQTKLFDAKRKVNADIGEVVVLDAQGCPGNGPYEYEYTFKGNPKGEVPSGSGISFTSQRFCVLSEKPTTVTVTVVFHCPDGKIVKDTATIVIQ